MKTTIYITLITLFYSTASCAQTKFMEGKMTINNNRFEVVKPKTILSDKKVIGIFPERNKYKGNVPAAKDNWPLEIAKKDIHVDLTLVKEVINAVLKNKIQQLHIKEEKVTVMFIFETNGLLVNTNYIIAEDSIITPAELEQIDDTLRKKVKATFTGPSYKHYEAVHYYFPPIVF